MSEPQWPYTVSREIGLRVAETLKVPMSHALQGIQSLVDPLLSIGRAMRGLEMALYHAACASWLDTHRRLPGSTRTKRLRKKRQGMVLRAWLGDF